MLTKIRNVLQVVFAMALYVLRGYRNENTKQNTPSENHQYTTTAIHLKRIKGFVNVRKIQKQDSLDPAAGTKMLDLTISNRFV